MFEYISASELPTVIVDIILVIVVIIVIHAVRTNESRASNSMVFKLN